MGNVATLFFGLLWYLFGKGRTTPATSSSSSTSSPALPVATPPWPQVVPPGLPTFPGSGWEFDEPPPRGVQQRAGALVQPLWARGAGAWKIEQTDGRWIAYQAQVVASGKRGVVAYREKKKPAAASVAPAAAPRAAAQPAPSAPYAHPQATPRPVAAPSAAPPPSAAPAVAPASAMTLPTLRYGVGLKPAPPSGDVVLLQQRLGGLVADGRFGGGTLSAVKAFQSRHALDPDGIVGPKTWAALFAGAP